MCTPSKLSTVEPFSLPFQCFRHVSQCCVEIFLIIIKFQVPPRTWRRCRHYFHLPCGIPLSNSLDLLTSIYCSSQNRWLRHRGLYWIRAPHCIVDHRQRPLLYGFPLSNSLDLLTSVYHRAPIKMHGRLQHQAPGWACALRYCMVHRQRHLMWGFPSFNSLDLLTSIYSRISNKIKQQTIRFWYVFILVFTTYSKVSSIGYWEYLFLVTLGVWAATYDTFTWLRFANAIFLSFILSSVVHWASHSWLPPRCIQYRWMGSIPQKSIPLSERSGWRLPGTSSTHIAIGCVHPTESDITRINPTRANHARADFRRTSSCLDSRTTALDRVQREVSQGRTVEGPPCCGV